MEWYRRMQNTDYSLMQSMLGKYGCTHIYRSIHLAMVARHSFAGHLCLGILDGWIPHHPTLSHIILVPFLFSSHRPQQQLKQQDEGLDMLSKSAERLGALSMGISEELGQQNT